MLAITPDKTSALVNEAVTIVCTIAGKIFSTQDRQVQTIACFNSKSSSHVYYFKTLNHFHCQPSGKPRPAITTVTWTHSGGYDISSNYTTNATGPYDLTSTLALTELDTNLTGVFTCKVGSSEMSTAEISIARKFVTYIRQNSSRAFNSVWNVKNSTHISPNSLRGFINKCNCYIAGIG